MNCKRGNKKHRLGLDIDIYHKMANLNKSDLSTTVYSPNTNSTFNISTDTINTNPADDAQKHICRIVVFMQSFIFLGILFLFGNVGNYLAIITLWSKRKKSATSFLLICLAVVDNAILTIRFFLTGKSGYITLPTLTNRTHTYVC